MKTQNVLFLCNHNSARSQMAEALLNRYEGERFKAFSAGLDPRPLLPAAVEAMNEIGIDISGQTPKSISEFMGKASIQHAIFLCPESEASCPRIYPFANNAIHWRIQAPSALVSDGVSEAEAMRTVRDIIDRKIRAWLAEMAEVAG